jgi:hypothetical protein
MGIESRLPGLVTSGHLHKTSTKGISHLGEGKRNREKILTNGETSGAYLKNTAGLSSA